MSAKISKLIVLFVLSISLLLGTSACNKKVIVTLPSNGCGVTACTNEPNMGGIEIK